MEHNPPPNAGAIVGDDGNERGRDASQRADIESDKSQVRGHEDRGHAENGDGEAGENQPRCAYAQKDSSPASG